MSFLKENQHLKDGLEQSYVLLFAGVDEKLVLILELLLDDPYGKVLNLYVPVYLLGISLHFLYLDFLRDFSLLEKRCENLLAVSEGAVADIKGVPLEESSELSYFFLREKIEEFQIRDNLTEVKGIVIVLLQLEEPLHLQVVVVLRKGEVQVVDLGDFDVDFVLHVEGIVSERDLHFVEEHFLVLGKASQRKKKGFDLFHSFFN